MTIEIETVLIGCMGTSSIVPVAYIDCVLMYKETSPTVSQLVRALCE